MQTEYTFIHPQKNCNFMQDVSPFFLHGFFDDNYIDCRYALKYSVTKGQKTQLGDYREEVTELEMER